MCVCEWPGGGGGGYVKNEKCYFNAALCNVNLKKIVKLGFYFIAYYCMYDIILAGYGPYIKAIR